MTSEIEQELTKLHRAVHYGADTVMDLSTGGDIPAIRKAIIEASPVPVGTVPIYEAITRVRRVEDVNERGVPALDHGVSRPMPSGRFTRRGEQQYATTDLKSAVVEAGR